jgi:hypothetical protein
MEEHPHRGTRYARSIRVSVSPYCAIVTLEHLLRCIWCLVQDRMVLARIGYPHPSVPV